MSTIQIESLWQYIQTLSLSKRNRKWLAERLLENETTESSVNATTLKAMKDSFNEIAESVGYFRGVQYATR